MGELQRCADRLHFVEEPNVFLTNSRMWGEEVVYQDPNDSDAGEYVCGIKVPLVVVHSFADSVGEELAQAGSNGMTELLIRAPSLRCVLELSLANDDQEAILISKVPFICDIEGYERNGEAIVKQRNTLFFADVVILSCHGDGQEIEPSAYKGRGKEAKVEDCAVRHEALVSQFQAANLAWAVAIHTNAEEIHISMKDLAANRWSHELQVCLMQILRPEVDTREYDNPSREGPPQLRLHLWYEGAGLDLINRVRQKAEFLDKVIQYRWLTCLGQVEQEAMHIGLPVGKEAHRLNKPEHFAFGEFWPDLINQDGMASVNFWMWTGSTLRSMDDLYYKQATWTARRTGINYQVVKKPQNRKRASPERFTPPKLPKREHTRGRTPPRRRRSSSRGEHGTRQSSRAESDRGKKADEATRAQGGRTGGSPMAARKSSRTEKSNGGPEAREATRSQKGHNGVSPRARGTAARSRRKSPFSGSPDRLFREANAKKSPFSGSPDRLRKEADAKKVKVCNMTASLRGGFMTKRWRPN